jgi:nitrogen regulatory protein PII 2
LASVRGEAPRPREQDGDMTHHLGIDVRAELGRECGQKRSAAPGILAAWSAPPSRHTAVLKEVLAILRPERWTRMKARLQRLRLPACTQQRVLGRGRERGLRYLPRQGASRQTAIRYLPKRMISWIVEAAEVEPLVQAIIETNHTGQLGDGKIFVLPVAGAVRIRTADRGLDALHTPQPVELLMGKALPPSDTHEPAHASRE